MVISCVLLYDSISGLYVYTVGLWWIILTLDRWSMTNTISHTVMCPKLTQYETHKHYITGFLKPWSPSASWIRGVSMGGPIALWTKDYNGFCDVICSPLQRLAWLKAVSHNGTCSRPSDVAWKSFRENDFKIDYLFYTTNIGGHRCLQNYLTSYCEKRVRDMDMNLVLWIWSTRTRTQTLSTRTHTFFQYSYSYSCQAKYICTRTHTRTQDLCTRPNPASDAYIHRWFMSSFI